MMKNLNHNVSIIKSSLSILSKWIVPRLPNSLIRQQEYEKHISYWQNKVISYLENYGSLNAAKRSKTIRALVLAYLSGNPIRVTKELISINKEGLPRDVLPLVDLIKSKDPVDLKFLLTLLSVTKVLTTKPFPNHEPITKVFEVKLDQDWSNYIRGFFAGLHVKENSLEHGFSQYHLSTKTSPNSHGALGDALGELFLIEKFPELYQAIKTLGGKNLEVRMDTLRSRLINIPNVGDKIRKLSYISDKECKTRIVAILDYWSQTSLIQLHESLLKILKRIKADQTFDQGSFVDRIRRGPYYSFDLKDATDRFPISLQKLVLTYLIGEDKAKAWQTILVQQPFDTPEGIQISYNTGQPMGAYSSWATFAITHHLVVYRAACMAGKPMFSDYALLGDDIVICDRDVASNYESLMLALGIEFSPTKTFKSEKMFEFASRVFLEGQEISPFSLKGVWESCSQPAAIVEFLRTMQKHGWNLLREGNIPGQIRSLIRLTNRPVFRKWDTLINVFYQLPLQAFYRKGSDLTAIPILQSLSCFPNQYVQILQNAMISELREKVESKIEEITDLHFNWAFAMSKGDNELFRSLPGDNPVPPGFLPLLGCWHRLKREARELANELAEAYDNPETDLPIEKWVSMFVGISNTPDVQKVIGERKHKRIILTSSSLILSALKRASK